VSGSEQRTERAGGRRPPLRRVLVFTHAGLSACFALAAIVALFVIDQQHHEATLRFDATRDARSLAAAAAVGWDRPPLVASAVAQQTTESDGVQIFSDDGAPIVSTGPTIPSAAFASAQRQGMAGAAGAELLSTGSQPVVVAWAPVKHGTTILGSVTLMEPVSPGLAHSGDLAAVLALAVLAVLLAGLIGWLVGRWIAGPIELLADAAYKGAVGSHPPPIPRRAVREAAMFASTLRSALERSEQGRLASVRQADQQRRLVQQVSHNLRTPLSVLALRLEQLEILEERDDAGSERARVIARMRDQLAVLALQIDEVISVEDGVPPAGELPPIDLGQVVSERLAGLRALADYRGQRIVAEIEDGVRTKAVVAEIGAVVDELVVNAVKFAPERSVIGVSVKADTLSRSALFAVSDAGPGIPASERREVVKAHVRGARADGTPGSGLGLHLVSEILEAAQGSLHLRDVPSTDGGSGHGLEARVVLPLDPAD
jgi:signal transduction histidine kinase